MNNENGSYEIRVKSDEIMRMGHEIRVRSN
jgi:hypothetical protein